jgi:WD40 repeat protein
VDVEENKIMWEGKVDHQIPKHNGIVQSVAASEDGSTIVSCADNDPFVRVWNPESSQCRQELEIEFFGDPDPHMVVVTPNGDFVCCSGSCNTAEHIGFLYIWHLLNQNRCYTTTIDDCGWVKSLAISKDARFCAVVYGTKSSWNKNTRQYSEWASVIWALDVDIGLQQKHIQNGKVIDGLPDAADVLQDHVTQTLSTPPSAAAARQSAECLDLSPYGNSALVVRRKEKNANESSPVSALRDSNRTPCTCPAVAWLDDWIVCDYSAAAAAPATKTVPASTTIAVGTESGEVAFLRLVDHT